MLLEPLRIDSTQLRLGLRMSWLIVSFRLMSWLSPSARYGRYGRKRVPSAE